MRGLFFVVILSNSFVTFATAEDRCNTWAGYMARMLVPGLMSGLMGYPGAGSGGYGPSSSGGGGFGGDYRGGIGMGMGIGIGLGAFVPPLTDDVTSTLKGDRKAIQSKYEQYVLTLNELMAEWGRAAEKQMEAIKNGKTPDSSMNPKIEELSKKMFSQAEAFKKEMFAYGNKNKCMQIFETALQSRQFDEMSAIFTLNNKIVKEQRKTIANLKKTNRQALAALEECRSAAPSIDAKLQKTINDIRDYVNGQDDCPTCDNGSYPTF